MDYNKLLEKAREAYKNAVTGAEKRRLESIFLELAESEDERIRKELINYFKYGVLTPEHPERELIESWIAWLEKQDKHKDYYTKQELIDMGFGFTLNGDIVTPDKMMEDMKKYLAWKEKQSEQKPTDKVEPKFEIEKGKWYVCNTSRYIDFVVGKAYYCPKNGMLKPNENEMARYVAKHHFRLWTIQDAKDGDVLADDDSITIFRKIGNDIWNDVIDFYICYNSRSDKIIIQKDALHCGTTKSKIIKPATKEQCELLFSKIKEAGYEWDAEQKQLKKIDDYCKEHCKGFQETGKCYADGECKAKRDAEQNPAWSEEDKKWIDRACMLLDELNHLETLTLAKIPHNLDNIINHLKSLKNRIQPQPHWKPTEEQLMALRDAIDNNEMESLYNDLKKL